MTTTQSPVEEVKSSTKNNEGGPYELTKGYEIDFEGDSKYHVKIGLSKLKKLKITVTELSKYNNIYEAKFDHEELIAIDKFFGLYDKIEDIVREMDNLFTKNCISISMDMAHSVIFEIQISINNKPRLIRLKLTKRGNEQTEALNNLCNLVTQQTKKLELLERENLLLKEKVGKLNEKLDNLKNNPEILGGADSQFVKAKVKSGSNKLSSNKKGTTNQSPQEDDEENKNDNEDPAGSAAKKTKKPTTDEKFSIDQVKSVSLIIREMKDIDFIIKKINVLYAEEDFKFKNIKLLYSASEDGDACTIFHSMCDGTSPLLIFIKTNKGLRFGGFTSQTFECSTTYKGKVDDKAFIFSLDKKKIYEVEKGKKAICCYKNYGPVFYGYEYCNIYLVGNLLNVEGNVAKKGDRYNTTEDYEINGGEKKFMAEEVEVFQVILEE
jgi:hypothetical protein